METDINLDHHISQQFNQELEAIRDHLMQMGGIVEYQVGQAIKSLVNGNSEYAQTVINNDVTVNHLEVDIDDECIRVLARRQPAASDLRFIISVSKAVNDLERIGDEAEKIAKHAIELCDQDRPLNGYYEIRHLGDQVLAMVKSALDAFARLDAEAAFEVLQADKAVDLEYATALRAKITLLMEDPRSIARAVKFMWSLRSLERIGDHARNIAEDVIFLVKGKDVRHLHLEEVKAHVRR